MFYILNSENVVIANVSCAVDTDDLATRGEWLFESEQQIECGDTVNPETFEVTPRVISSEELIKGYQTQIQTRLDEFAQSRGYDGIMSACTYATSTVEKFRVEGQYCVDVRDATWSKCYEILALWEQGAVEVNSYEDIESQLPVLEWPL